MDHVVIKNYVCGMPKSPRPRKGRTGKDEDQDWYHVLKCAIQSIAANPHSTLVIPSAFKCADGSKESEFYRETSLVIATSLGIPDMEKRILVLEKGTETIGQLHALKELLRENENSQLLIVSTFLHTWRIRYLCWKDNVKATHKIGSWLGFPRWAEACTDIVFTFLFPLIDSCGLRKKFLAFVESRRAKGTL